MTFTGPPSPVTCNAPTSIEIHFETRKATAVTLSINGGGVLATYSNGDARRTGTARLRRLRAEVRPERPWRERVTVSKTLTINPACCAGAS